MIIVHLTLAWIVMAPLADPESRASDFYISAAVVLAVLNLGRATWILLDAWMATAR